MLICLGGLIQILTSIFWTSVVDENTGEIIFYLGQDVGELCYLFAARRLVRDIGFFVAASEYLICLSCVDIITVLFLNPLEVSPSKFTGFIVASFVLLCRIKQYRNKNG